MPYGYLANQGLWGDTAEGMGNSFNNAIVGLARLRFQQQQAAQQQALDRGYLDLAVRKLGQERELQGQQLSAEAPERAARVGELGAQTKQFEAKTKESELAQKAQQDALETSKKMEAISALVASALRAHAAVQNPAGVPQTVPITPQLSQVLGPQTQFDQQSMLNALQGIIQGGGAQAAFQGVPQIGSNLAALQAGPAMMLPTPPRAKTPQELALDQMKALSSGYGNIKKGNLGVDTPETGEILGDFMNLVRGAAGPKGARLRVQSKDGTVGSIPAEQKDAAIAEGYKIIGE